MKTRPGSAPAQRAKAARQITRIVETATRMQVLFADGKAHNNAEIKYRTRETERMIIAARGWMMDRGTYLYPSTSLGEGWWQTTEDVALIKANNLRATKRHYSETCRKYRATAGACVRNPTDIALQYEQMAQQATAMQLGSRLGLTPAEIANHLMTVT
jgi:hypothetical protein